MSDPYLILGIGEDADDAAVEVAYLEGIKRYPPERDPKRFEALRAAYETLRTRRDRLGYELSRVLALRHPQHGMPRDAAV